MNIYVGNLAYGVDDAKLKEAFEEFGQVSSAQVIMDNVSGRSRGFGFVEMPDKAEAEAAMEALNGKDFDGRALTVNEARPRADGGGGDRGDRGGRGGGDRGGDRGGQRW
jgi:RNA recognition motif-containing protein